MKKTIFKFIFLIFIIFIAIISYLSIYGYETNRFNNLIYEEISKTQTNLKVNLNKIRIKIDIKKLGLFLSTKNPSIQYNQENIPINLVKIYLNLKSFLNKENIVESIFVDTNEIEFKSIQKIALKIKPSNIKNFLLNSVKSGKLKTNLNLKFDKNNNIKEYNFEGFIKKTKINYLNQFNLEDLKLIFSINEEFFDLNSITGKINDISIKKGNLLIQRQPNIKIEGEVFSEANLDEKKLRGIIKEKKFHKILENKIATSIKANNKIFAEFDKTLKIKTYNFETLGEIGEARILFKQPISNRLLSEEIRLMKLKKSSFKFSKKNNSDSKYFLSGEYSFDENKFNKFRLESSGNKSNNFYNLDIDFSNKINIEMINYFKEKGSLANLKINLIISKNFINIKDLLIKESKNLIEVKNLKIDKKNNLKSFEKIKIVTNNKNKENNNFEINFNKKIEIKGKNFDSANLLKSLNKNNNSNNLKDISSDIEIKIKSVHTEMTEEIKNFYLIGKLDKGKFSKISSKGEFSNGKYLDISMKNDKSSKKKFLEIYSDIQEPVLSNFSFFKSINGGNLLFNSVIEEKTSTSKLLIEKFKIKDAPDFVKLLALADFAGMADLVSGKGLSFDKLEMKYYSDEKILNLEELYTVGPSISILMEGYIDKRSGLVSLRGTMVPAKELNKLISKIPILGDILIPKEVGEGLFGVSFKMKGKPGEIKTTVNPIRTLTPRFIQKALEKKTN